MLKIKNMYLGFLPYETQVNIFDKKCANCPMAKIQVVNHKDQATTVTSISEAVDIVSTNNNFKILRSCTEDGGYSLKEITANSCILWGEGEHDTENDLSPAWSCNG